MHLFGKKEEYEDPEEFVDLNSPSRRKRKLPPKPWTKTDRIIVLTVFLTTIIVAGVLDITSKNWKLPNVNLRDLNPLKEETITLGGESNPKVLKANKIITQFKSMTDSLSGVYAFSVIDLETSYSYGVNNNEVMSAASLMKLPLMALTYTKKPGQYVDLIERMAKHSDNQAYNYLRQTVFTPGEIDSYIEKLGLTQTNYSEDETSPADIAKFFADLWNGKIIDKTHTDHLLDLLTVTDFEKWLAAGISEVKVAHKYGREVGVVNDAGIIYADKPFVLVIMTQGVIDQEADAIFPQLASMIYLGQIQ